MNCPHCGSPARKSGFTKTKNPQQAWRCKNPECDKRFSGGKRGRPSLKATFTERIDRLRERIPGECHAEFDQLISEILSQIPDRPMTAAERQRRHRSGQKKS